MERGEKRWKEVERGEQRWKEVKRGERGKICVEVYTIDYKHEQGTISETPPPNNNTSCNDKEGAFIEPLK